MELYESDLIITKTKSGKEGISRIYKNKRYKLEELKENYRVIKPIIEKITGKEYHFKDFLKKNGYMYLI